MDNEEKDQGAIENRLKAKKTILWFYGKKTILWFKKGKMTVHGIVFEPEPIVLLIKYYCSVESIKIFSVSSIL